MRNPIIIVGAGPAGLACLSVLHRLGVDCPVVLCDVRDTHLDQTRLHEASQGERAIEMPLDEIAHCFSARYEQVRVDLGNGILREADSTGTLRIGNRSEAFSALVIASGSAPRPPAPSAGRDVKGLRENAQVTIHPDHPLLIVGGGPSAIQYAAQISETHAVRVVTSGSRILEALPQCISAYAHDFLADRGVDVETNQRVEGAVPDGSLWLAGLQRDPELYANRFGQIRIGNAYAHRIFGAGDCCEFDGDGLNTLSAQSAIRKGKLVGRNILRQQQGRFMLPYDYSERGYIVSLGDDDAVGWVGSKKAMVTGRAAVAAKATVDEQYRLLLKGIDTFI